jgi:hypothetical protein
MTSSEAAADQAIGACGGDAREAVKALILRECLYALHILRIERCLGFLWLWRFKTLALTA